MPDFYETGNGYFFQKNKNGKTKRISRELFMKKNASKLMKGGAFPYQKGKGGKFTILAKVTGDTLDRVNERRIAYNLRPLDSLHITLLDFYVNLYHPLHVIFSDPGFHDQIKELYRAIYIGSELELDSTKKNATVAKKGGNWEILGGHGRTLDEQFDNKFWARVYTMNPAHFKLFQDFKLGIIHFITTRTGLLTDKKEIRGIAPDREEFTAYSTQDGNELYCVNTAHYGNIKSWKPHISVLKLGDLKISRLDIYDSIKIMSDEDIIETLRKNAPGVKPISNIITKRDLTTLRVSFDIGAGRRSRNMNYTTNPLGDFINV
jgi:hypothetical protein